MEKPNTSAISVQHPKAQPPHGDGFLPLGHVTKALGDDPPDGVEFFIGKLRAKALVEVLDGGNGLHAPSAGVELLDKAVIVDVVLILDFPNDLLEHVLDGDHPRHPAILIHHNGHVVAVFPEFREQHVQALAFRNDRGGTHVVPKLELVHLAAQQQGKEVLGMKDALHIVRFFVEDGKAGVLGINDQGQEIAGGRIVGYEDDLAAGNGYCDEVAALAEKEGAESVRISAQVEAELVELGEEECADYLEGLGVSEGGLRSLIRATYRLLGLRTYFPTGEKETRAWTFRAGMTAPQTAGVIHTDFERGFIRAQTIGWEKLLEAGSLPEARNKGWLRSEGKDYLVAEGDVMEFLLK